MDLFVEMNNIITNCATLGINITSEEAVSVVIRSRHGSGKILTDLCKQFNINVEPETLKGISDLLDGNKINFVTLENGEKTKDAKLYEEICKKLATACEIAGQRKHIK